MNDYNPVTADTLYGITDGTKTDLEAQHAIAYALVAIVERLDRIIEIEIEKNKPRILLNYYDGGEE